MRARWIGRLAEIIEDWTSMVQRDGWRSSLAEAGRELARLPYRHMKMFILACSLEEPLPDLEPKIALEIRPFCPDDVDLVRQIHRPSEAKLCARRLERGQIGLLALHKGQPVGHAWASDMVDPTLERVHFELQPGDAICLDVYTAPAFRGKGVQTTLALARSRVLRDRGFRRVVTYIDVCNHPSLAVWQRKLGSQIVGRIDFVRVGPFRRVRFDWEV